MDETKGKSAHLAQNGGSVHGQTRAWGHREEEEEEDSEDVSGNVRTLSSLFEKGEEEEKMVDVDDNDDHTVTDDERIRLVSGLKMRPDSTAFARAARGARDEGIREQYPNGDINRREFSSSIVSKMTTMTTMTTMMRLTLRVLFASTRSRSHVPAGRTTTRLYLPH